MVVGPAVVVVVAGSVVVVGGSVVVDDDVVEVEDVVVVVVAGQSPSQIRVTGRPTAFLRTRRASVAVIFALQSTSPHC